MTEKETLTYEEAAALLQVKIVSVRLYAVKKKLAAAGKDKVTKQSVLDYLAKRDPVRSRIARITRTRVTKTWTNRRKRMLDKIYTAIVEHYIEHGYAPVFDDLSAKVGLARSGLSRFMPELVEQGRIELHGKGKQILMAGMAEHTKEWAKANAKSIEA